MQEMGYVVDRPMEPWASGKEIRSLWTRNHFDENSDPIGQGAAQPRDD